MYAFTIPNKAYAAGETIPVSVKFSPLAKNVRIVSLVTTIREHTSVVQLDRARFTRGPRADSSRFPMVSSEPSTQRIASIQRREMRLSSNTVLSTISRRIQLLLQVKIPVPILRRG